MNFIESIRVERGTMCNTGYHLERSTRSILHHFGLVYELPLKQLFDCMWGRNGENAEEIYKCRVVYSKRVISASLDHYMQKQSISLKVVTGDNVEYPFKYEDRGCFDNLLKQKGSCDDIIIVKRGLVTDTSYGNIVYDLNGILYTPVNCLLKGTRRGLLLREGIIAERDLHFHEIEQCRSFYMINAMLNMIPAEVII